MSLAASKNSIFAEVSALLAQPVPRMIPEEFNAGFHVTSAKSRIRNSAIFGVCLLALAALIWFRLLPASLFFLVGVGTGVGAILLVTAFVELFNLYLLRRPFRKFRDGKAIDAVIEEICLAPTQYHNGIPSAFAFCAECRIVDPVDSMPETFTCQSRTINPEEKEAYTTDLRVGDIAPALYQPNARKPQFQLFGFMGLQPGYGIIKIAEEKQSHSYLEIVISLFGIICLLALPLGALLIFDRCTPIVPAQIGWVLSSIGAPIIGGIPFAWIQYYFWRAERSVKQQNAGAAENGGIIQVVSKRNRLMDVILCFSSLLFGWFLTSVLAHGLNAGLDSSKPIAVPIEIVSVDERSEKVVFAFPAQANRGGDEFNRHVPLETIRKLKDKGIAQIKKGAFGWEWVQEIHPPK